MNGTKCEALPISVNLQAKQSSNLLGLFAVLIFLCFASFANAQEVFKVHGISKFGELKYGPDFKHLDYVNPDAPKGGEFSRWDIGAFDSLHAYISKGAASRYSSVPFEALMVRTLDEPDSYYGLLAESLEYPEDYKWAIFNLRPEARFSDGSPLTAEDVVYSHNLFTEKGIPSVQTFFAETIESVEALDDHRVKFTFTEGNNTRDMVMLVAGTIVFSKEWWSTRDFAETTLDPVLGSGPYVYERIEPGKTIVFRRNENYWGKDLPINVGQNNFDTIRIEYYADATAAFEGFKAGETLFRNENSSLKWSRDYNFPAIENGWAVMAELPNGKVGVAQGFYFNMRRAPFDDIRVRQALGLMLNFEWSNKTLFFNLYSRVDSFYENSDLEAKGEIPDDERAILEPLAEYFPETVFTEPAYSPPVSSEQQVDRAQIRAAGKLLDEAGWTVGDDGMRRNAQGEVLAVEFLNYAPAFDRILNPYIENLKMLGVDAVHTRIDPTQYSERVRSHDFDMISTIYGNGLTPGLGLQQWYGSENADVPSRNRTGLKNEGIDQLIDIIIASENRDELNLNTRALDRALRSMHMWVGGWYKGVHTLSYYDMYRHPENLPPYALGEMSIWWYDAERGEELKAEGAF